MKNIWSWSGLLVIVIFGLVMFPQGTSAFEPRGNTSSAKWVSQIPGSPVGGSTVIYANPGSVLNFALTIKNTSKTDVFYSANSLQDEPYPFDGAHELRVGATNDVVYDNIFDFSYGGPFEHNNRFIAFESGAPVYPGDQLTFYWNLKVKSNISNGSYRYAVGVVQEYDAWLGDRPGPGAGGPNNNLGGRSGGTIFWDIVIGGSAYNPVQTLNNPYIGISVSVPSSYSVHGLGLYDDPYSNGEVQIIKNNSNNEVMISRIYDYSDGWPDEFPNFSVFDWSHQLWQINNSDGYTVDAQIYSTLIDNKLAYTFNVKNGFSESRNTGETLPSNVIYKVILTNNNWGQKIIIRYNLGNSELEQIVSSIKFIDTKIFTNTIDRIQFIMPNSYYIKSNSYGVTDPSLAEEFYFSSQAIDSGQLPYLDVSTVDEPSTGQSFNDFVQDIYIINKNKNQIIGNVRQITIGGAVAYEFDLQNGYNRLTGGMVINFSRSKVTFLQHGGKTFTFLQFGYDSQLENILYTLQLI